MSTERTEESDSPVPLRPRGPTVEEQIKAKGTPLIGDGSAYANDALFPEPGEYEEFIEFVRESRRASAR